MAMTTGKVVALIQTMGGGADPAVIESAVQAWLDAHPEATTTVQDGSITEQKLATSIAQKLGLISSLSDEIESIDDRVTVLENGGTDGASPIINSASGAVASFADGSASPARSAVVTLAPVQDLHGFENPWPAGGGKNKFNSSDKRVGKAIFGNESIGQQAALYDSAATDTYVNVAYLTVGTWTLSYSMDGTAVATGSRVGYICDADGKVVQKGITTWSNTATVSNIVVTEEGWLWASVDKNATNLQLESGSSASTYAPYSNICPISGHTGTDVQRTGKNLLDESTIVHGYYDPTDVQYNIENEAYRIMKLTLPAGTYTISTTLANAVLLRVWYDGTNHSLTETTQSKTITTTINGIVAFCFRNTSSSEITGTFTTQIECGSTATAYEPYNGTTLSVAFPTAAGTVYGGTYDFVSGKLIVDRARTEISGGFEKHPSLLNAFYKSNAVSGAKAGDCISNQFPYFTSSLASSLPLGYFTIDSGYTRVALKTDVYSTAADFNAALAQNPLVIVYPLATPIEYDLTPQELNTLLGQNNVWSTNGTNTAVEYKADTKLYIDGKIAELSALIASL